MMIFTTGFIRAAISQGHNPASNHIRHPCPDIASAGVAPNLLLLSLSTPQSLPCYLPTTLLTTATIHSRAGPHQATRAVRLSLAHAGTAARRPLGKGWASPAR